MLAAEPDEATRTWYLLEHSISEEGKSLRAALMGQLATTMGQLTSHEHFQAYDPGLSVVGSPDATHKLLATEEINDAQEAASTDGETILWATTFHDTFAELPWQNKSARKLNRQDGQFVRRGLRRHEDGQVGESIFERPDELATALETWAGLARDNDGRSSRFLELITEELHDYAKNNWRDISRPTLAGHIQGLAHAGLATNSLERILSGYFEGPDTELEQLQAYWEFCMSVESILEDGRAVDKLAEIICFTGNPVLPTETTFHQNVSTAYSRFVDEETTHLGHEISSLMASIVQISSQPHSLVEIWGEDTFRMSPDEMYQDTIDKIRQRHGLSVEEAERWYSTRARIRDRINTIGTSSLDDLRETVREAHGEEALKWMDEVYLGPSRYTAEYFNAVAFRTRRDALIKVLEQDSRIRKVKDVFSIPVNDQHVVDVYLAQTFEGSETDMGLVGRTLDVEVQKFLADIPEGLRGPFDGRASQYAEQRHYEFEVDGQVVSFTFRRSCKLDQLQEHELNQLMWQVIPDIEDEAYQSATEIADRIKQYERRFVSQRGFSVGFKSVDMVSQGFESITFKQDPQQAGALAVTLMCNGQSYRYRINSRKQLDLEGRQLRGTKLRDRIERRTLAILEDYATREAHETSEGSIAGAETGTRTRIPTIAYLPVGHKFSQEAWEHYRVEQGGDLRVKSMLMQERDPQRRNATYRRATEVDDPNIEPLEIYIQNPQIV